MKYLFLFLFIFAIVDHTKAECDQGQQVVLKNFLALKEVGALHNCEINVVVQDMGEQVRAELWAKDNYRCSHPSLGCREDAFSLNVKAKCLPKEGSIEAVRYSYGYKLGGENIRSFFEVRTNHLLQIVELRMGRTELNSSRRISYIECRPEIFTETDL